jgi:predicted nucleotidyltransferase
MAKMVGAGMRENDEAALSRLKQVLKGWPQVLDIVVYGSKARGDDTPDSDIDVMVRVEDYTPEIESAIDEAVFEINLAYECFISTVIFGRREIDEGPMGESPLYKRIEEEGIPV